MNTDEKRLGRRAKIALGAVGVTAIGCLVILPQAHARSVGGASSPDKGWTNAAGNKAGKMNKATSSSPKPSAKSTFSKSKGPNPSAKPSAGKTTSPKSKAPSASPSPTKSSSPSKSTSPGTAPACDNRGSQVMSEGVLNPGECLTSGNGKYTLMVQTDGDLVLRQGSKVCWSVSKSEGSKLYPGSKLKIWHYDVGLYNEIHMAMDGGSAPKLGSGWGEFMVDWEAPFKPDHSYSVSLNNSGKAWLAYEQFAGC